MQGQLAGIGRGDLLGLTQIIYNLLVNAVRYTPPMGPKQASVFHDADAIRIEVSDNGICMSAELIPRLVELFAQEIHRPIAVMVGLARAFRS